MNLVNNIILSTAYFPPIQYFSKLLFNADVFVEGHEHFIKQSYRNRCVIATANGLLTLSIPIKKQKLPKVNIQDTKISYDTNWQKLHWKALESAYRNSPYFEYLADDIFSFFTKKFEFLFDYNSQILSVLVDFIGVSNKPDTTQSFVSHCVDTLDYRNTIHPKKEFDDKFFHASPYTQVFSSKYGFFPNLSILDLLFNEGNLSKDYLEKCIVS